MSQMLKAALTVNTPLTTHEILNNFEGREGKFIKGFLLNDKRNKNGWAVDWDSIKKYAADWINHPGIYYTETGEPDHTDGGTYRENMVNQEGYRVVNIVSVIPDEATHTLNYVGEILDADFEKDFDAGLINMTSPGIWPEDMETVGGSGRGCGARGPRPGGHCRRVPYGDCRWGQSASGGVAQTRPRVVRRHPDAGSCP